ncbi:MAG: sulfotransferase [Steroidobacteraceae bacterium]
MNNHSKIELVETRAKRIQRYVADARYLLLGIASPLFLRGSDSPDLGGLQTFCCFVGHGRSGGTLVGALLNAHPNIVMSNELNALRRLHTGMSAKQLYRVIYLVSGRQVQRGSKGGGGYSYAVASQWQGRHRELRIIGDRKAGATAYEIVCNPELLTTLQQKVKLEKKFIHVIRNPFDTITTTFHKTLSKASEESDSHLSREIRNYFARCTAVHKIEEKFGPRSIFHLHHEQLIADPESQLRRLCQFLNVDPCTDYIQACASIVMKSPHLSRTSLKWPEYQVAEVMEAMRDCHWLTSYTLDS